MARVYIYPEDITITENGDVKLELPANTPMENVWWSQEALRYIAESK